MVYLKGIFIVRQTFVVLLLTVLVQQTIASHARIAYKKPIAGSSKTNKYRERRVKVTQTDVQEPAGVVAAASMQINSVTERPMANAIRDDEHSTTTATSEHQHTSTTPPHPLPRSVAHESAEQAPNVNDDAASTEPSNTPAPCTCGIFLASQIKRGGRPEGKAIITNELDRHYTCNAVGQKQCQTKCLETIVQHLPNSANILCATLNRDCRKERAYLFIKNCRHQWVNTNLAAGREYCCKNGQPYQCPMV